jgi:hypothetical protein
MFTKTIHFVFAAAIILTRPLFAQLQQRAVVGGMEHVRRAQEVARQTQI